MCLLFASIISKEYNFYGTFCRDDVNRNCIVVKTWNLYFSLSDHLGHVYRPNKRLYSNHPDKIFEFQWHPPPSYFNYLFFLPSQSLESLPIPFIFSSTKTYTKWLGSKKFAMPSLTAYEWPQLAHTSFPSEICVSSNKWCKSFNVFSSVRSSSCVGACSGRGGKPSYSKSSSVSSPGGSFCVYPSGRLVIKYERITLPLMKSFAGLPSRGVAARWSTCLGWARSHPAPVLRLEGGEDMSWMRICRPWRRRSGSWDWEPSFFVCFFFLPFFLFDFQFCFLSFFFLLIFCAVFMVWKYPQLK